MRDPLDGLQEKTERDILIIVAGEVRHLAEQVGSMATEVGKQNGRIKKLEEWRWYIVGAVAAMAPFVIFEVTQWIGG